MYPCGALILGKHPRDGTSALAAVADTNHYLASLCKARGYDLTRSYDPGSTSAAAGINEMSPKCRYVMPGSLRSPTYHRVGEWDVLVLSPRAFINPGAILAPPFALSYPAKARKQSISTIVSWIESGGDECDGIWLDFVNPGHENARGWVYRLLSPFASLKVYSIAPICSWTTCQGCWRDARVGGTPVKDRLCLAQFMRAWQWLEREMALRRGCLVHDMWSSAILLEAESTRLDVSVAVHLEGAYKAFLAQRARFHTSSKGNDLTPAEAIAAVSQTLVSSSWFLKADVADMDGRAIAAKILTGPLPPAFRALAPLE